MTDDPKRAPRNDKKVRHHEVDVEPPGHPGEPRRVVSSDHESGWHEPVPEAPRSHRQRSREEPR